MSLYSRIFNCLKYTKNTPRLNTICGCYQATFYSAKAPRQGKIKEVNPLTGEVGTKKTTIIPKITLLSGDSVSVTTLQEAENISKRRDLKLVKILDLDTKSQRPVYKLMTGHEYLQEDIKQREQRKKDKQNNSTIKGEKVLTITSRIAQHDLETGLKKCEKWISKMYEVRVIITGSSGGVDAAEKVYNSIVDYFKNHEESGARILQKVQKGNDIRFQINPPKKSKKDSGDDL